MVALTATEDWLSDHEHAEARFNEAFERFECEQPVLAERLGGALAKTADEVALALGYFLTLVIWLSFDQSFSGRLGRLDAIELRGVEESLKLDEELRVADPAEPLDSDDVVGMEQPHALQFVQEHVDATLDEYAAEADVDEVHAIYRLILVEILALSYAVAPPDDYAGVSQEICA